jgi:hypothetical protein
VQVVDKYGQATAFAYLGAEEVSLELAGLSVPGSVISAAHALADGTGEFVDSEGNILAPKDLLR